MQIGMNADFARDPVHPLHLLVKKLNVNSATLITPHVEL